MTGNALLRGRQRGRRPVFPAHLRQTLPVFDSGYREKVTLSDGIAIFAAGIAAGTINTVVGSGTLITFPVLLALGYAPVTANVSNTIGLVPGSATGAIGYRRELAGQRARVARLATASLTGG